MFPCWLLSQGKESRQRLTQIGKRIDVQVLARLHHTVQHGCSLAAAGTPQNAPIVASQGYHTQRPLAQIIVCLLYTSDAADDLLCVDLGGRCLIKKKKRRGGHRSGAHGSSARNGPYLRTQ